MTVTNTTLFCIVIQCFKGGELLRMIALSHSLLFVLDLVLVLVLGFFHRFEDEDEYEDEDD